MWPKYHTPAGWPGRGHQGTSGPPVTTWTPLQLSLLQGFWRSDLGLGAAPVALWQNSSGVIDATRDLTQTTAAFKPATRTASDPNFGGATSVSSTAPSDQRLVTGTFTSPAAGAATMFCVARCNTPIDYQFIMHLNPGAAAGQTAQLRLAPIGGGNYGLQLNTTLDTASYLVDVKNKTLGIIGVYSSTSLKLFVNSLTPKVSVPNGQPYNQPTKVAVLGFEPIGVYGGATMVEAGLMAGEMTPADIGLLYNYWNVTRGYGLGTIDP